MKCPGCQAENPLGTRFCGQCAAPLASVCPSCGASNPPANKFCGQCAAPLDKLAQPLFAAPESYTPKHLAERILVSKAALEGERKQVTVLFADLKGSMELLAGRDPEEARRILDPVLEHMMEAVHRYEGTVNQVMGDGIMALFGAPLALEDHAVRACYAALRIQEVVKQHAEGVRREHDVTIRIRVGLNSGEVVVRTIGSDLRMDYTAVGQTTHLAARMEQLADPGSILLSSATLELAKGYVEVKPLGPLPVKGLSEPVQVYELVGGGAVRSRLHAAAARGLTRFVSRDGEVDQLHQALERASTGHGQVVAVVGEPGVGKSRLYWEFIHSRRTHGWLVLESGSVSYGKATVYLPVIELLKAYFQIEGRDDTRRIREKVTGKVLSLDRQLELSLPALLSLLDVPVDDGQWERLDPPQRRQRTLDGVKRLVLRESQVQPLLVLFEDLHWIDTETQALLDGLVEALPTARLLLLVNYRPEYQHGWGGKTYYRQLRVDPLPGEGADDLLGSLLGADASLGPLKRRLIERTEGNPLFLEESVRSLVETGGLIGERGAYRLAQDSRPIQVPTTVQAILAARIDRQLPEDKRLLQAASVVGKDVLFTLLQEIGELPEEALRQGLARLQTAEFLYEARLFPDLEYTFKHALTHQVAYEGLLHDRRRDLHGRIVGALKRLYPDRLAEHVERLAHHAVRGEVWDTAVTYLQQAGAKAAAHSVHREAVVHFEQALAALRRLPETRETSEHAIDIRFALRGSLMPLGEIDRFFAYLRDAESLARKLGDQRRLGWASTYLTHYLWLTGRSPEARTLGQSALVIGEAVGAPPLQVAATLFLGYACHAVGDYREAKVLFEKTLRLLEGDQDRERSGLTGSPTVMPRGWLAFVLAERGMFDEGVNHCERGIQIAEALNHPFSVIVACWALAYLYCVKGDWSHAAPIAERGLAVSREWNLAIFRPMLPWVTGRLYASVGRVEEGLSLLHEALSAYEATGVGVFHSLTMVHVGEAYLAAQRPEDALMFAERALSLARDRGERGHEAYALRLLGEIASPDTASRAGSAEAHYRNAVRLAEELEMRPLVAHCHLGLGKLSRRAVKGQQAQEHLSTAITMYRDMGMTYWLEQAEAEMRELG